mmetsp:Transcript_29408/g.48899  ORF Transcript_29408/g.48899 Transcript_29408/m.48899 type:complete len:239 (-) Transcript_29408:448-1164(-)
MRCKDVEQTSKDTDDDSSPGFDSGTACGNSDQSSQATIHGGADIIRDFSNMTVVKDRTEEHGCDSSSAGSQGSVDDNQGCDRTSLFASNYQNTTRVESVPSKPEAKCSKELQSSGMRNEGRRFIQKVAIFVIEASDTGAQDQATNQCSNATRHVNSTRSSQIDCSRAEQRFCGGLGEDTVGTPEGVGADGVDKSDKENRVHEVGLHLSALGNSTSDNGRQGTGKGELEEPALQRNATV